MRIEATGIAAGYGSTPVLRNVDVIADAGQVIGLIGANGSGKTTLLRILANLREPDEGAVRYSGQTAAEIGARALARRISYLAQGGDVHWPMQVETLVALGRLPHRDDGHSLAHECAIVERAMMAADVLHLRDRTMSQISGGERMRILLARALAVEGEFLLADEPIAALDPLHQLQVMEMLHETARQGRGVIVVLHDLALASRFCDRLVLLAEGGVLVQGSPQEVLTDDNVKRAYGVDVVRGERDGVPYLVPWAPSRHNAG